MRCALVAQAFTIAALFGTKRPCAARVGVRMTAGQTFSRGLKVQSMHCKALSLTTCPAQQREMRLQGTLTKYGPKNAHTAFISGQCDRFAALL